MYNVYTKNEIKMEGVSMNGQMTREELLPIRIVDSNEVENVQGLLEMRLEGLPYGICFASSGWVGFQGKGSYVLLDFGKELCGGIRMVTRECETATKWRLTFGESVTEAVACIGEKNATNDHSPRDFEVMTSNMSDLEFGQTGFRFVRIELLSDTPAIVQNIVAVSHLPAFEKEAEIVTNDAQLNQIIKTAAYTLKLCFQKGYIWDGIKRDRLVWCGDLHQEVITSLYLFGDNENVKNSLLFLRKTMELQENTDEEWKWINWIPSYSAWWVINLCDYCTFTGNQEFFRENREYALEILKQFDALISENGEVSLTVENDLEYFLDWPSCGHPDAVIGVSALLLWMAQKFVKLEKNENAESIIRKLSGCVEKETSLKQVRAFQVLAGRNHPEEDLQLFIEDGAKGISTFMAYYILTAMAKTGGTQMLEMLKQYYGGMLEKGATTFWEDFDIAWLENSSRIDEFPKEGEKDIHGDFGKFCYEQFRHSLCHGWSSGVLAFIVEHIIGLRIEEGGEKISVTPHLMGLTEIEAKIPLKNGTAMISIHGEDVQVSINKA